MNATFKTAKKIRKVCWANDRREGILGDQDGVITFINERNGEPIYALKAHNGAITQLMYIQETNILISASKDKHLKFWSPPEEWMDKRAVQEDLL